MQLSLFFFFNDTATTEIYPLSLHDALPIYPGRKGGRVEPVIAHGVEIGLQRAGPFRRWLGAEHLVQVMGDRKSTRLNSSHLVISYAVFCLKKKNNGHQFPDGPQPSGLRCGI